MILANSIRIFRSKLVEDSYNNLSQKNDRPSKKENIDH